MQHIFSFSLYDGHVLIALQEKTLLIDTGTPQSLARESPLVFCDRVYELARETLGISCQEISSLLGREIDAIIGTDILDQYDVVFDSQSGQLSLSTEEVPLIGSVVSIERSFGVPVITAAIGNEQVSVYFDSGAKISYATLQDKNLYPVIRTDEDFFPLIGTFDTPIRVIPMQFGTQRIELEVGQLPTPLAMTLQLMGVSGIVGSAVFMHSTVVYAPRRNRLAFIPVHG
jgi:hypothetical protein